MAKFWQLPLFTDAWVADTSHLTRCERGLYMDLLILCWRSPRCRVPNQTAWVARKLLCSDGEIETLKKVIAEFMSSTGNYLYQKRLLKEFNYLVRQHELQSARAKARYNKEKGTSQTPAAPETRQASGSALSLHSHSHSKRKESCPKTAQVPPSDLLDDPEPLKAKRGRYAGDFEEFWKIYPTDPGMSKQEAAKAWAKLTPDDRQSATIGIPGFKLWIGKQKPDYRTLHACRYLSQRRFEGFAANGNGKLDWRSFTHRDYTNVCDLAKRFDHWHPAYGPPDKIPPELMDDDLRRIVARASH